MNKRARRKLVMAKRYAKLDQRQQESQQAKEDNRRFEAEIKFVLNQNHPMAKIARELTDIWNRRVCVKESYDTIMKWHADNPELSVQLKAYMEQAQKDFKESYK
jgi:hypothetical protein